MTANFQSLPPRSERFSLRTLVTTLLIWSILGTSCAPKGSSPTPPTPTANPPSGASTEPPVSPEKATPEQVAIQDLFGAAVELDAKSGALEAAANTESALEASAHADISRIIQTPSSKWTVEEKLLRTTQVMGLLNAYQSLTFHRILTQSYDQLQISKKTQALIQKRFPSLGNQIDLIDRLPKPPKVARERLLDATVDALIWKGNEIGAMAEKIAILNQDLLKAHYEAPDLPQSERPAALAKIEDLSSQIFVLRVEIDRRLGEQPAFAYLNWPVRVSGQEDPVSFYVVIREQLLENARNSQDGSVHSEEPKFESLKAEVRKLIELHHPTVQSRIVQFIDALVQGDAGAIAPLASARWEATNVIGNEIDRLASKGLYPQDQPTPDDFIAANDAIESEFGFRDGEYNEYTEVSLYGAILNGVVAAELSHWASKIAALQTANAAVKRVAAEGTRRVVEYQAKSATGRVALAVGERLGARYLALLGLRVVGAFNPIILVGSSIPLAVDGYKYYQRKMYRKFLKSYIPASFLAGVNSASLASFSQSVDDGIMELYLAMDMVSTVFLAARFADASWITRTVGGARWLRGGVGAAAGGASWTWKMLSLAPTFLTKHIAGLMATMGHYALNPAQLARASIILLGRAPGAAIAAGKAGWHATRVAGSFIRHQSVHIPFIMGSITMAMDVHWRLQGYGLKDNNWIFSGVRGVVYRAFSKSDCIPSQALVDFVIDGEVRCQPAALFESFANQYRNAFMESKQAAMDLTSIAISDGVLSYASISGKLSFVALGHLYAWVSAASDVAGQLMVQTIFAPEGEEKSIGHAWEHIQWGRVHIHYSMVSTFSTSKMEFAYKPMVEGHTIFVKQGLVQIIAKGGHALLRGVQRAELRLGRKRPYLHSLAHHGTTTVVFAARYVSSLLSNWVGNAAFIYVAMALKSNAANVPSSVPLEVIQKVKDMLEGMGLEYTPENIRNVAAEMREVSKTIDSDLRKLMDAEGRNLQNP